MSTPPASFFDTYGLYNGESILLLGPPGTGKSHFAGSVCKVVDPARVLLLCPKPREATSYLYRHYGLEQTAEVFSDHRGWRPDSGKYEATAWKTLFDRVDALENDDKYDAVVMDPITDAFHLLSNRVLADNRVGSYGEMGNTQSFFASIADKGRELVDRLVLLTSAKLVKRPKFVICTVHTQPPKEDQQLSKQAGGGTKKSADHLAEGIEYEGKALPQVLGSYRRQMMADFGICLFADVVSGFDAATKTMKTSYVVQAIADADKHAKVAPLPSEALQKIMPNEFEAIYKLLKGGA